MSALSGEPWNGASVARHLIVLAPQNFRAAWVTAEVSTTEPTGDKATYQGNPRTSLTLRFRWTSGGTPAGTAPNFATVKIRLLGSGVNIGSTWTVAFPAADTDVTRTFHFDTDFEHDPLDEVLGPPDYFESYGLIEMFLEWGNTGGAIPWSADSRGGGTPVSLNRIDHARGELRMLPKVLGDLSDWTVTRSGYNGPNPPLWAIGGDGTKTFAVTSGSFPTGMTLSSDGQASGTPTVVGDFTFEVVATDANTIASSAQSYTVTINPLPTITTIALPNAVVNIPGYSQAIAATGGTGSKQFNLDSGSLPNGLTLSMAGVLSGTPTLAIAFNFVVMVTDETAGTDTQAYTVIVTNVTHATASSPSRRGAASGQARPSFR